MDARTLRLLEYDKIRDMLSQHAASSLGKELVERTRPARDVMVARTRLEETTEARRLQDSLGEAPLGGLHDVREVIRRAEKLGVLTAAELLDVADTAACCRRLRRYFARTDSASGTPKLREQGQLLQEFTTLEKEIDRAIAPNGEVVDTASPELGRLRRRVRALHDEIQRELQRTVSSSTYQAMLQDPIITQRNGRFCVPVRAEERNAFKGIVHDISASGQTAFMEPLAVVELGNDLREAERREEEEVQRVLATLSGLVGAVASKLLASMDTVARLDLIFARASFARALDAIEPEINTDGMIDLQQARHPLLGASAVPIDVMLGEEDRGTLLITGPNTGGKTVTLKTVGLFVLMAQSGMHVPALPGTRLAIFDQVFADIGDEQSIEQSLSTFSSHMTNIVRIVKEAGPRALVLFDEIGAGTDPAEGAALAKAILLELLERGCRTIATTHYGELKAFAQSTEGFLNASVEFDLETLRPTYRVITGLPGSSNALSISQRLGLPKPLIARAKELMGDAPQAMEQVLKQAEGVRRALDRERTAAVVARRDAERTSAQLKKELCEFEEKREASLGKARQQAQDVLQKARQEAGALLDELKGAIRETRESGRASTPDTATMRNKTREVLGALTGEIEALPAPPTPPSKAPSKPALSEVSAGQTVIVRSLGYRGVALESGIGDAEVEVQVGIMRVHAPVSDLEAAAPKVDMTPPPPPTKAPRQVDPEIHLLGLRAEEATERLEEYLYEALDSGLTRVRIVHGYGTGALRSVVQDVLRHHIAVKQYRPGEPREGGGGVTIAEVGTRLS